MDKGGLLIEREELEVIAVLSASEELVFQITLPKKTGHSQHQRKYGPILF